MAVFGFLFDEEYTWRILSILLPSLGVVTGIGAIALAIKQRRVSRESLSMAGLVTGIIGTVLWGLLIVYRVFM